jgi:hypothetical protein
MTGMRHLLHNKYREFKTVATDPSWEKRSWSRILHIDYQTVAQSQVCYILDFLIVGMHMSCKRTF